MEYFSFSTNDYCSRNQLNENNQNNQNDQNDQESSVNIFYENEFFKIYQIVLHQVTI